MICRMAAGCVIVADCTVNCPAVCSGLLLLLLLLLLCPCMLRVAHNPGLVARYHSLPVHGACAGLALLSTAGIAVPGLTTVCMAGWSSPGIAHYLGAELPTTENGLASSLKILSRGDSGLMCLANNELQPRWVSLVCSKLPRVK